MNKHLILFVSIIAMLGTFCGCSKRENQTSTTPSPATNTVAILDPELKRNLEERVQVARYDRLTAECDLLKAKRRLNPK